MKCGYKYCKYGGEVSKKESVKYKNRYYHKDCLEERLNKTKIKELFLEKINKTEPYTILQRTINNIIHNKHIDSNYLLFAVKYAIDHNIILYNSKGLYILINNPNIKKAYQNKDIKYQRYGDFVILSEGEYNELLAYMNRNERKLMYYINKLNNYIGQTGKQYKSHFYTIKSWFDKDEANKPIPQSIRIHNS